MSFLSNRWMTGDSLKPIKHKRKNVNHYDHKPSFNEKIDGIHLSAMKIEPRTA
ncbi:hypothetical protein [Cupriavidus numazuensis]|uniref:hypothetical protein n=1 Tax=Cupriavidus numazuensis TaxID=221992 RepID=UPI001BAA0151|nr:hypothetical protein [Cupriavidus numazuensis]